MKRGFIVGILVAIFSLTLFAIPALATEVRDGDVTVLGEEEYIVMEEAMQNLDMGQMDDAFVLYNHLDVPKFILGTSDVGYIIFDRDTWAFLERAASASPFYEYDEETKYYGGIGLYFIQTDEGFYDLMRDITLEQIPYIEAIDALGVPGDGEGQGGFSALSVEPLAASVTNQLFFTDSLARRFSFGNNAGTEINTCTAVATGLILNYLDRTVDGNIVSSAMDADFLSVNGDWDVNRYSKANALHQFLVYDCGMESGTFLNLDIGVWGPSVSGYFDNYRNSSSAIGATGISCESRIVNPAVPENSLVYHMSRIASKIDKGIPAMMTTTLQGLAPEGYSQYGQHTMMICGYDTALSSVKVHKGWYNNPQKTDRVQWDGSAYRATLVDVPLSIAVYMYYFDFNPGWHQGGDGSWRYFSSNGQALTGLQTINGSIYGFNGNGVMLTGWQTMGGSRYYFGSDGAAYRGWRTIYTKLYFFDLTTRAMQTSWMSRGGPYGVHFASDGSALGGGYGPAPAPDSSVPYVYASTVSAEPGATVAVTVTVNVPFDVRSMSTPVYFDDWELELLSSDKGIFDNAWFNSETLSLNVTAPNGPYFDTLPPAGTPYAPYTIPAGTYTATYHLKISEDAPAGVYPLSPWRDWAVIVEYVEKPDASWSANGIGWFKEYNIVAHYGEAHGSYGVVDIAFGDGAVIVHEKGKRVGLPQSGDFNGDGIVTASDATRAAGVVTGSVSATADQRAAIDMDGDGIVTMSDATRVMRKAAGLA
jgi:hypothetical protein